MKVVITSDRYCSLTGAELYIYELSRVLRQMGHEIVVAACAIGGDITDRTRGNGVRVVPITALSLMEPPDVLHLNQRVASDIALTFFPRVPAVMTVHSEFACETPLVTRRIAKYVCIRESVARTIQARDGVEGSRIIVIPNGIDRRRFCRNTEARAVGSKVTLFAGTIDRLRRQAGLDMIRRSVRERFVLVFVGQKFDTWLDESPLPDTVLYYEPIWGMEKLVQCADETAGIMLGRTTIEGWACGKPGWIYEVLDEDGSYSTVERHEPPVDMDRFDIHTMALRLEWLYTEVGAGVVVH